MRNLSLPFAIVSIVGLTACASAGPPSMGLRSGEPRLGSRNTASITPIVRSPSDVGPTGGTAPRDPDPTPERIAIPGSELVHGRANVVVNAPIGKVRDAVLDFPQYPEFMPHYETCKVLGRTATGARQLYMGIEALHGAVHMWAQV